MVEGTGAHIKRIINISLANALQTDDDDNVFLIQWSRIGKCLNYTHLGRTLTRLNNLHIIVRVYLCVQTKMKINKRSTAYFF